MLRVGFMLSWNVPQLSPILFHFQILSTMSHWNLQPSCTWMYATLFICSANSVAFYLAQIEDMDALFEAQFSTLTDSGRILSKCGKCLRYMKFISTQPSRLYCGTCEEVYYLPQKGTIKVVSYSLLIISTLEKMFSFGELILLLIVSIKRK